MKGIDVSSWLLVEDSGDSEGDTGFFSLLYQVVSNDDDAESCTCDTAGTCGLSEDVEGGEDEMWLSDTSLEIECSSSPLVVEDEVETRIVKVNVNDVEDKIFWETCMAVGYP
ncbi:hypothetical protein LR48_Vigan09g217500 [Vigna angularis]|uniref:Uncharacterized protein n=2 Tax=Phaseolus angularis TaxID=3914 RepID=A0A0L9VEP1_PHAAN|nr:hypothetical protein LR48_Vigan09g217500 [Vigna angularis]BAT87368.1 hypothetical protein VIGAN_05072900 [Vigna angularis var. angularis]